MATFQTTVDMATIVAFRGECEKIARELPEPYSSRACAILDRPHWLEPWGKLITEYLAKEAT
jgi:hypothetical protein